MKQLLLVCVLVLTFFDMQAQNPDFSLYLKNHIYFNPAYAGTYEAANKFGLIYRSNTGYNFTRSINAAYTRSGDSLGTGYGVTLHYQKENFLFQNAGAKLHYSYGIPVGEDKIFSIGGAVGGFSKIITEGSTIVNGQQVYLEQTGKFFGVLDFGIMFFADKFKLGASAINVNNPRVEFFPGYSTTVARQYFILAAYEVWENGDFAFTPSVLLNQSESYNLTGANIILNGKIYETIEVGIGFKSDNIFRKTYVDYYNGTTLRAQDFIVATATLNLGSDYSINVAYESLIKKNTIGYLTNGYVEASLNFNL